MSNNSMPSMEAEVGSTDRHHISAYQTDPSPQERLVGSSQGRESRSQRSRVHTNTGGSNRSVRLHNVQPRDANGSGISTSNADTRDYSANRDYDYCPPSSYTSTHYQVSDVSESQLRDDNDSVPPSGTAYLNHNYTRQSASNGYSYYTVDDAQTLENTNWQTASEGSYHDHTVQPANCEQSPPLTRYTVEYSRHERISLGIPPPTRDNYQLFNLNYHGSQQGSSSYDSTGAR